MVWLSGSDEKNRRDERWDHFTDASKMVAKDDDAPLPESAPPFQALFQQAMAPPRPWAATYKLECTRMMENFCEDCRIQFKSYRGYRTHVTRGEAHKEAPYSTDRGLTEWEKRQVPKSSAGL